MEKSVFLAPVWISPLEKSKQAPKIRISPLGKSIYECIYAHIWIPNRANPNMCINACMYGFLRWGNAYFWHQLGFLQWGNPNWPKYIDLSIRKIHTCMHICIYLGNPNMCIYACIYGFLGWGNPYCRYRFGFLHWRNENGCQQIWNLNSWDLDSREINHWNLESRKLNPWNLDSR